MSCPAAPKAAEAAGSTASKPAEIPEVPAGCEEEEQLLQALTSIPLISKAIVRPGGAAGGERVDVTVSWLILLIAVGGLLGELSRHKVTADVQVTQGHPTTCFRCGMNLLCGFAPCIHYAPSHPPLTNPCAHTQVLAAQHNLPANSKRSLQYDVIVPNPAAPEQVGLGVWCAGIIHEVEAVPQFACSCSRLCQRNFLSAHGFTTI